MARATKARKALWQDFSAINGSGEEVDAVKAAVSAAKARGSSEATAIAAVVAIVDWIARDGVTEADLKKFVSHRAVFATFDFAGELAGPLRAAVVSCFSNDRLLKKKEHRRFLEQMLRTDAMLTEEAHSSVLRQLPTARSAKVKAFADCYLRAWRGAETDEMRQTIEELCIQNLMNKTIHAARADTFKVARSLLRAAFFDTKRSGAVSLMLWVLFKPILWRALKAANAAVRHNAARLFFDAFPLGDPAATTERTAAAQAMGSTYEEAISTQLSAMAALLGDRSSAVRSVAVEGVAGVLASYWEALPAATVKQMLVRLIKDCAHDVSSKDVRAAVFRGLRFLLDNVLSHATIAKLLPALGSFLHDRNATVRVEFAELLCRVTTIQGMSAFDACPLEAVLAQLVADAHDGRVCKPLMQLLMPTFHPEGLPAKEMVKRMVAFVAEHPAAALVFYSRLPLHIPSNKATKLLLIAQAAMNKAVRAAEKATKPATAAAARRCKPDSLKVENLPLMAQLARLVHVLWTCLEDSLSRMDDGRERLLEAFVGGPATQAACAGAAPADAGAAAGEVEAKCDDSGDEEDSSAAAEAAFLSRFLRRCVGRVTAPTPAADAFPEAAAEVVRSVLGIADLAAATLPGPAAQRSQQAAAATLAVKGSLVSRWVAPALSADLDSAACSQVLAGALPSVVEARTARAEDALAFFDELATTICGHYDRRSGPAPAMPLSTALAATRLALADANARAPLMENMALCARLEAALSAAGPQAVCAAVNSYRDDDGEEEEKEEGADSGRGIEAASSAFRMRHAAAATESYCRLCLYSMAEAAGGGAPALQAAVPAAALGLLEAVAARAAAWVYSDAAAASGGASQAAPGDNPEGLCGVVTVRVARAATEASTALLRCLVDASMLGAPVTASLQAISDLFLRNPVLVSWMAASSSWTAADATGAAVATASPVGGLACRIIQADGDLVASAEAALSKGAKKSDAFEHHQVLREVLLVANRLAAAGRTQEEPGSDAAWRSGLQLVLAALLASPSIAGRTTSTPDEAVLAALDTEAHAKRVKSALAATFSATPGTSSAELSERFFAPAVKALVATPAGVGAAAVASVTAADGAVTLGGADEVSAAAAVVSAIASGGSAASRHAFAEAAADCVARASAATGSSAAVSSSDNIVRSVALASAVVSEFGLYAADAVRSACEEGMAAAQARFAADSPAAAALGLLRQQLGVGEGQQGQGQQQSPAAAGAGAPNQKSSGLGSLGALASARA